LQTVAPTLQEEGYVQISGPDGVDNLYGINSLQFADQTIPVDVPGLILQGTQNNDSSIRGGEGNDEIYGLGGNDSLFGFLGNDRLEGGFGNDLLVGGDGEDRLYGGAGDDQLFGQVQSSNNYDQPVSDGSKDYLYGNEGNDFIFSLGSNYIDGGSGQDVIYQFSGSSWVSPGYLAQAVNNFYANPSNASGFYFYCGSESGAAPEVYGGEGDDVITVHHAAVIDGGPGNDFVIVKDVEEGSQGYNGGVGYDTLVATYEPGGWDGDPDDRVHAFRFTKLSNFEQLVLAGWQAGKVVVPDSLAQGIEEFTVVIAQRFSSNNESCLKVDATAEQTSRYVFKVPANEYYFAPILILLGGAAGDTMEGGTRGDQLVGNGGDDMIFGRAGNDALTGGPGNDVIDGGDGEDTAVFSGNRDAYTIDEGIGQVVISGPDGVDTVRNINQYVFDDQTVTQVFQGLYLVGTEAPDTLEGGNSDDTALGLGGNDTINGGGGNDELGGGEGADLINGGTGNDQISGDEGNDTEHGGDGNDMLSGGGGNDELTGGDGNDVVSGGDGNDLIIGGSGAGDDTYTGGPGIDTVKYTSAKAAIRVDLTLANNNATSVGANDAAGIGNDQIEGVENVIAGKFNDVLKGDNADNQFTGDIGNDSIDGAGGRDTAVYTGARNQYSLVKSADRMVTVTDNRSGASDGVDTLSNVEVLQFSDSQVLVSSLPISNNPNPPSILVINSDLAAVSINLGASFSHQITASGSPTSFGATRLPTGLKLNAKTGLISGKPTKVGVFSVTLQALKKGSTTATATKVFTVVQVPTFMYAPTINAKKGKALKVAPTIAGYPAPTFSILTGSLPPGLSLNASTAAITGTPTTVGTYPFTVRGSNSTGNTDRSATIVVK
jgi:Ca2+-binding RTX toxin-like protein